MIAKRIPHQFVLALTFGVIAVGLAVAILRSTSTALRQADQSVAYATAELQGIRSLTTAHDLLRELIDYRRELVIGQLHSERAMRPGTVGADPSGRRRTTIWASLAAVHAQTSSGTRSGDDVSDQFRAVAGQWSSAAALPGASPDKVSAVISTIRPLLAGIMGSSGLTNDPSADGQNFGDALLRFPLSLAYASEAATIATVNLAAGERNLRRRFATAALLAQAQTAIRVGEQDAEDELALDPVAAPPLIRAAKANVRDFEALEQRVTQTYVEADGAPRRADGVLASALDRFTASSFSVMDALSRNLLRVTNARIDGAHEQRRAMLMGSAGSIFLELALLLTLGWISLVSYQNGRKRLAAERAALESQRTGLEVQLTHAKAQQALLSAKAQFRTVFDRAPTGMIIVDRQCEILDTNEAARAMLEAPGEPMSARCVVMDRAAAIEHVFAGESELYAEERKYVDRRAATFWFHVSVSPVRDESGAALFAILMIRDVTASKSMEEQLVFEAGHDELTGLPNRKCFLTLLQAALDDRRRAESPGVFSVVFIDFNDFKTINDSFGHQAGDKFLVDGAARLRDSVRSTDIVARIGGDEFAVMLHGTDRAEIEKSVTRLQSLLCVPVNIEGQLVASSASFGIAQAELSYTLAAEIIRDADTAMYQAKAQGGRNYVVFDVSMREKVVRRMQLSIDIVNALEHHEMELRYQPIVNLDDGKIAGCEALLRWRRADGGFISPAEFLPLAEENGSIIEIGHWVTRTACEQMHAWTELANSGHLPGFHDDFVVHVNLAVPEVHHADLLANLRRTLAQTRVARDRIILEITEGIVLKNTAAMRSTLDALTKDGFRLCIDDFGTGYSSLRYLNELPLHSFKIDRSFVSNGSAGLTNVSIVEMLMVLSRSLDLTVVAEGIETSEQWDTLRDLGCRYGQGYLFAPALDPKTLTAMLQADVALANVTPAVGRALRA